MIWTAREDSFSRLQSLIGVRRKTDDEAKKDDFAYTNKPVLVGFRNAYVFDVSRTGGADPSCYQAKADAHVAKSLAAKFKLVQISTGYRARCLAGSRSSSPPDAAAVYKVNTDAHRAQGPAGLRGQRENEGGKETAH